jgi:hypothetical protein
MHFQAESAVACGIRLQKVEEMQQADLHLARNVAAL